MLFVVGLRRKDMAELSSGACTKLRRHDFTMQWVKGSILYNLKVPRAAVRGGMLEVSESAGRAGEEGMLTSMLIKQVEKARSPESIACRDFPVQHVNRGRAGGGMSLQTKKKKTKSMIDEEAGFINAFLTPWNVAKGGRQKERRYVGQATLTSFV